MEGKRRKRNITSPEEFFESEGKVLHWLSLRRQTRRKLQDFEEALEKEEAYYKENEKTLGPTKGHLRHLGKKEKDPPSEKEKEKEKEEEKKGEPSQQKKRRRSVSPIVIQPGNPAKHHREQLLQQQQEVLRNLEENRAALAKNAEEIADEPPKKVQGMDF